MAHLYLDKRKNPPIWRFQIWTAAGIRKSFTGTTSKRETAEMAIRRQAYEKELTQGLRATADKPTPRVFKEVMEEYLDWGNAQGGRGGRPWGTVTARNKKHYLNWWRRMLSPSTMHDLIGSLARVEKALRVLKQDKKRSGKTLCHYIASLKTFISWSIDREYLDQNPIKKMTKFDQAPKSQRRAMNTQEIRRLLEVCAEHRKLLYETAFCTGLRAGELKSLTIDNLDDKRGGVVLCRDWTKNRMDGFQPLPAVLIRRLKEAGEMKLAQIAYSRFTRKTDKQPPNNPLLYVPSHAARDLDIDLKRAKIAKTTSEGKIDFHACRVAYITHLIETGADVKTVQTLARHSDPRITLAVYAKARPERLADAAEAIGKAMLA